MQSIMHHFSSPREKTWVYHKRCCPTGKKNCGGKMSRSNSNPQAQVPIQMKSVSLQLYCPLSPKERDYIVAYEIQKKSCLNKKARVPHFQRETVFPKNVQCRNWSLSLLHKLWWKDLGIPDKSHFSTILKAVFTNQTLILAIDIFLPQDIDPGDAVLEACRNW